MYRNAYQRGILTIFFSGGSKPLNIWDTKTQDGYISVFLDQDIKAMVLEIGGTNVSTSYMICPKGKEVLGITMPFLVMVVKNLKKYFSFEVTILDDTSTRRRFRVSNFQSTTKIMPMCTAMPIGLSDGWNQIQFNLAEFTRRAYKKQFVEVQKLKINANIRLRRIYFTERLIPEDELPPEYKLYFPLASKGKGKKSEDANKKENEKPQENVTGESAVVRKGSKADDIIKPPSQEGEIVEVFGPKAVAAPVEEVVTLAEDKVLAEAGGPPAETAGEIIDPKTVAAPVEEAATLAEDNVVAEVGRPPAEITGEEKSTVPEGSASQTEPPEPATME